MNRLLTIGAALCAVGTANAAVYVFTPNPANLDNLDHYKFYSWGIDWQLPANEVIVEAELKIKNIYDWIEEDDHLYTHLLDNPQLGFQTFTDDQGEGDNWDGDGPLIGVFSDPAGGQATGYNLVYKFSELGLIDDLNLAVADGRFGFGFDPDCHYFNDGAKFKITTAPVPEPASMIAIGVGIVGLSRRRLLRKKA